jgi:hypothetical protein
MIQINEGDDSPWEEIDYVEQPFEHVPLFWVSTPGHGGYMVHYTWAQRNLSRAALESAEVFEHWYCYEEDSAYAILYNEVPALNNNMTEEDLMRTLHWGHKDYMKAKGLA